MIVSYAWGCESYHIITKQEVDLEVSAYWFCNNDTLFLPCTPCWNGKDEELEAGVRRLGEVNSGVGAGVPATETGSRGEGTSSWHSCDLYAAAWYICHNTLELPLLLLVSWFGPLSPYSSVCAGQLRAAAGLGYDSDRCKAG